MSEIAWAAGLFDGEGTATICRGRPRLAVQMSDRECVSRFAQAMGCGFVYGPYVHEYRDGYTRKPRFVWLAEGESYVIAAELLMPMLCTTKREAVAKNVETAMTQKTGTPRRAVP